MVQRLPVVKNLYRRSEVDRTMTQKKGSGKRQFCTIEGAPGGEQLVQMSGSGRSVMSIAVRALLRRRQAVFGRDKSYLISQVVEERAVCPWFFLWPAVKKKNSLQVWSHDCHAAAG